MLADNLRTDGRRFRPLTPASDEIQALRASVRGRDDLVTSRVAMTDQLRSLLESFWPSAAVIFADIDSPIALVVLARFPASERARRLSAKRTRTFMAQHRYSGRRSAEELLARLRAAPAGLAGEAEADAMGELVRALIRALTNLVDAIRELSSRIEHAVAELPDGRLVMSFPHAVRILAEWILAELGDRRERFQTDAQLAAEAGVRPVTHASGKSRGVVLRWACNHRPRAAVTCWADNSRHSSPWAADVYRRGRGRAHPHAVRILARAWLRVLWRARRQGVLHEPDRHIIASRLAHAP